MLTEKENDRPLQRSITPITIYPYSSESDRSWHEVYMTKEESARRKLFDSFCKTYSSIHESPKKTSSAHTFPFQTQYLISNPTASSSIYPQYFQIADEHSGSDTYEVPSNLQQQEQSQTSYPCNERTPCSRHFIDHDTIKDEPIEYQIYTEKTSLSIENINQLPAVKCPPSSLIPPPEPKRKKISNGKQNENKPLHKCPHPGCIRSYRKLRDLRTHAKTHSGIKAFACSWPGCTWKFARCDERTRHYRRHTGEKQYSCEFCGFPFSRSDHLKQHVKRHTRGIYNLTT